MHNKKRTHKMHGGFLDDFISNTKTAISNFGTTLANDSASVWDKTKKASSNAYNSIVGTTTSNYSITGGRKRKSRRVKRGGLSAYYPLNGVGADAAPFSGETAQPHNWVGGRKTRRRHKKTRSHRK